MQQVFHDGSLSLHTRSSKYGKASSIARDLHSCNKNNSYLADAWKFDMCATSTGKAM